jgi:2-polyprenyl-6-methoxyphenol hydroxylase-like FAD-dependent oxidoreductase
VAIIGDAAYVARPHVAAGVLKAVEDAVSLANALEAEQSVEAALKRFEMERVAVGRKVIARARQLGANYGARSGDGAPRLSEADPAYVKTVIEDTALVDFLKTAD